MNKTKGKEVVSRHELLVTPSPKGKLKNIITKTKTKKTQNTKVLIPLIVHSLSDTSLYGKIRPSL